MNRVCVQARSRYIEATLHSIRTVIAGILFATWAGPTPADNRSSSTELRARVSILLPGIEITNVQRSPVNGILEVVSGGDVFYLTEDGEYLFSGSLIESSTRTDLTAARRGAAHLTVIDQINESDMLVYEPEIELSGVVTVFTDTSCPYCSRLHAEIDTLLEAGIRVRYLMFPRAGIGSEAHRELESVWCADDPHAAMTTVKAGGFIDPSSCPNPIGSHIEVARTIGLRGTPLIYLNDGLMIPGYRPATELVQMVASRAGR